MRSNNKIIKSQSILEYLIILAAIIIAILANTIGLKTGVQNSLNTIQNTTAAQMSSAAAPKTVQGENYYTAPKQTTSSPDWNNTDTYGGPNYTGGYNYDEWVKNNPNSAYNAPAAGTVLETVDNSGGTNAN